MKTKDIDPDDICEETGKKHIPDWGSVSVTYDGDECYIDINCKDCGRSGCVGSVTLADNVTW